MLVVTACPDPSPSSPCAHQQVPLAMAPWMCPLTLGLAAMLEHKAEIAMQGHSSGLHPMHGIMPAWVLLFGFVGPQVVLAAVELRMWRSWLARGQPAA